MSKFTNDEIDNLIDDGKTNAEIARAMGKPQASVNARINRRRVELEKAKTEVKQPVPKQVNPIPELAAGKSFPFEYGEQILYEGRLHIVSSVGHDRMVIRENASLKPKTITADDYARNQGAFKKIKEKPQNTYERVTRNRPDEEPEMNGGTEVKQSVENLFVPEPKTKFEQVAEKLKAEPTPERKPGMTINREFEAAVQQMEAENKAWKEKEVKPCIHFLQNCRYCDLKNCEDCPDFKDGITVTEACETTKPFVAKLEEPFGSSPDYIDSEWGVAEKEISDTVLSRRDYLDQIDQLLDLLINDCVEPEMAEQTKKIICYKLVIGFEREIGQEVGA